MNIEVRLRSLEARRAAKNGVFVVTVAPDGKASFTTPKGKLKCFNSVDEATAALYEKYIDPCIIVIDWRRPQ